MLPAGATSEFVLLSGDLDVGEVYPVVGRRTEPVVVVQDGVYWVCTPTEMWAVIADQPEFSSLAWALSRYVPATVVPSADLDATTRGRIVVMDAGTVVAVVVDGALDTEPDHDREPTATAGPPTRPAAAPSRPPMPEPQQAGAGDRGPVRGGGHGGDTDMPREADEEEVPQPQEGPDAEPWNLETQFPRQVTVGSTHALVVELTRKPSGGPDSSRLEVDLSPGTAVDVVVQAKEGFSVEGPAEATLVATGEPLPIRFQLNAISEGSGWVRVLFFVEATALGAITLRPAILADDALADSGTVPSSEVISALSVGSGRPDLELLVLEEAGGGRPAYSIRVTARDESLGIHLQEFGPIELHTDARRFFAEMFGDIEGLDLSTADDRLRAQRLLETKGNHLFSTLFPASLQTLLWNIRDRITRIRIDSEEPYIPWELIRLAGPDDSGSIVEGSFLCEYEITRWIPGLGLNSRLTMADFGVVIPDDSGLASAQEEKAFLTGLAGPKRVITQVEPGFLELMEALAAGTHDVWHFSGHGSVNDTQDPNRAAIQLADGQRFTPEQISGVQANLGRAKPLVFLNACQIGRAAMSLTGLGGWARQFLDAGAAGFVGAMWNVHDNPARDFATSFYTRLLEGDTIGAATLQARNGIKRYQDATWLAYTVYGHPSAAMAAGRE